MSEQADSREEFERKLRAHHQVVRSDPISFAVKDGRIYTPDDPEYDRLMAEARKEQKVIPTIGRIVHFKLAEYDVRQIERRRAAARGSTLTAEKTGAQVHVGNPTKAGDVFPMLITRVWASPEEVTENTAVQGQVFLDGNDVLWVTSAQQGNGEHQWCQPPRV